VLETLPCLAAADFVKEDAKRIAAPFAD